MEFATNSKYLEFKKNAIENAPVRNEISLRDIKVVSNKVVEYKGTAIEMHKEAFTSLLKNLSVPKYLLKKFKTNLGEEQSINFLNAIRQVTANSNQKIVLVADPKTKKITNFLDPRQTVVSNKLFFEIFEKVVEKYTSIDIRELHYSLNQGVSISTINNEWEFGIKGLADEMFHSGINFKNDFNEGLLINPFNERLACTNGMIFNRDSKTLILQNVNRDAMMKFMQEIFDPTRFRYYEELFIERVQRMYNVNCSFNELADAYTTVKEMMHHSPTPDMLLNPQIPMHDVIADYKLHGIDVNKLDISFKKNAKTPVKVWDLVNTLTYHASHKESELGLLNSDRHNLQLYAGRLAMKKNYDTEALVPDIYRN